LRRHECLLGFEFQRSTVRTAMAHEERGAVIAELRALPVFPVARTLGLSTIVSRQFWYQ
jgi:hypothetical protein